MHLWAVKQEHKIQLKTLVRKISMNFQLTKMFREMKDFKHIRSRLTHERKVAKLHQKICKR